MYPKMDEKDESKIKQFFESYFDKVNNITKLEKPKALYQPKIIEIYK
jgi:hypothetical protein